MAYFPVGTRGLRSQTGRDETRRCFILHALSYPERLTCITKKKKRASVKYEAMAMATVVMAYGFGGNK